MRKCYSTIALSDEKEADFAQYMEGVTTVIKELLDPSKPFTPFDTNPCPAAPSKISVMCKYF